jgi:hypothetical protein
MRVICKCGSMSGMWKRSYGPGIWVPPDERGGNRQTEPTITAVESAQAIAGLRPSKNRTCELAPHPAQAWIKPLIQGAGTSVSLVENLPFAIRN